MSATAAPPSTGERVHPTLRELFDALERRHVRWSLLRRPSNLEAPSGDVDVLVAREDAATLLEVARGCGFVPVPGWEGPPELILISYHRSSDCWLILDISTSVSFRTPRGWSVDGAAAAVLRRRVVRDGVALPADGDAFWLLLLHCALDKNQVSAYHRTSLRRLLPAASDSDLGRAACASAGLATSDLLAAVDAGSWQSLMKLRGALRHGRSVGERTGALARAAARIARKPLLLRRRRGVTMALMGPNGVGKSTAAQGLRRSIPLDSRVIYMGVWKAAGEASGSVPAALEILVRPLRLWARYLVALWHQLRGRLVIFDRYVYEALLPPHPPLLTLKRCYFWFLARAVPSPNVVAVLDVAGQLAYLRKQENPPAELEFERAFYAGLARRLPAAVQIDASADPSTVRAELSAALWGAIAARWARPGEEASPRGRPRRQLRPLARMRRLLPAILELHPESLSCPADEASVVSAEVTSTGVAVIGVAGAEGAPSVVVKLPLTAEAAAGLRRETAVLAGLASDRRIDGWRELLPRVVAQGTIGTQLYRIDRAIPGTPVLERRRVAGARNALIEAAADAIATFHAATATTQTADSDTVERWVAANADELRRRFGRSEARAVALGHLQDELGQSLLGRSFEMCWIHGDYWLGNTLFTPAGRLAGIVDWEAAALELPLHDLLHLLVSTRRLLCGHELGRIVGDLLSGADWSLEERSLLTRSGRQSPGETLSERDALLLYWLRQVAHHARQQSASALARYRFWEQRNVLPVLRLYADG
jgi:aminoglycoside phosphotransferase (APT) family kinase protein/thymidylate kinase